MSRLLKPVQLYEAIRFRLRVRNLPDRKYVRDEMLPVIAATNPKNVLLVGTRRYTLDYPKRLNAPGCSVWTIDLDPDAAKFGNGAFHRVGDVCNAGTEFPGVEFDVVLANGLLGFGIDSDDDIRRFIEAMTGVLAADGYLMLGWDADRTADPTRNADITAGFSHIGFASLPARQSFVGYAGFDHVFDWFQMKDLRRNPK